MPDLWKRGRVYEPSVVPHTAARQIWAMSDVPSPDQGFDSESVFSNFYHVLSVRKRNLILLEIKRRVPWIMWLLWKNRNLLCFEGRQFLASDTISKIKEETALWFLAQGIERRVDLNQESLSGNNAT